MARRITRSAFLYMDPVGGCEPFAQCASCRFWRPMMRRCALFITDPDVEADATCGLYVAGRPSDYQMQNPTVWPKDAGFETRQVRCENCHWYQDREQRCHLFYSLNDHMPDVFDLDVRVHPHGCCNANTPEG